MKKVLMVMVTSLLIMSARAQFSGATLQATGLTCAMCSNAINKAIEKLSFVESVKSDIPNSAFNIVFRENGKVDIDDLKDAVEDAGFSVGKLSVTGKFEGVKVENDRHTKIGNDNFHFLGVKSQTLSGQTTFQLLEKNFLTPKEFKKYGSLTKKACFKTGQSANCCTEDGINASSRVYHVTII